MQTIEQTLEQRGSRYGEFSNVAAVTQHLYQTFLTTYNTSRSSPEPLPAFLLEGVHMICNKLARAACGDPLYDDNFRDIAGYSTLIVSELTKGPHNGN